MKTLKQVVESDTEHLRLLYEKLTRERLYREAGIIQVGCNLSLKPRELLSLRFDQFVVNSNGERFIRDAESLRNIDISNAACLIERDRLFQRNPQSPYLFPSHRVNKTGLKPVGRISVAYLFRSNECLFRGRGLVLEDLRKSWARRYLLNGGTLSALRAAFNHACIPATIDYLELQDVEGCITRLPPNGERQSLLFAPALYLYGVR